LYAVFGTTSPNRPITTRPSGSPARLISKYTLSARRAKRQPQRAAHGEGATAQALRAGDGGVGGVVVLRDGGGSAGEEREEEQRAAQPHRAAPRSGCSSALSHALINS
jgi:hypothetical protein